MSKGKIDKVHDLDRMLFDSIKKIQNMDSRISLDYEFDELFKYNDFRALLKNTDENDLVLMIYEAKLLERSLNDASHHLHELYKSLEALNYSDYITRDEED